MKEVLKTTRDIARELARKYSTMTHDELDILENILVPMKFAKGQMILSLSLIHISEPTRPY